VPIDRNDRDDTDETEDDWTATQKLPVGPLRPRAALSRPAHLKPARTGRRARRKRSGLRLANVRDPRAARRWFVMDVVFVVAAVVAIVVLWIVWSDNAGGALLFTVVALFTIANSLWEMRKLWPVTGWSRRS
jgi:uncharacterized paraquat-inducible protein A